MKQLLLLLFFGSKDFLLFFGCLANVDRYNWFIRFFMGINRKEIPRGTSWRVYWSIVCLKHFSLGRHEASAEVGPFNYCPMLMKHKMLILRSHSVRGRFCVFSFSSPNRYIIYPRKNSFQLAMFWVLGEKRQPKNVNVSSVVTSSFLFLASKVISFIQFLSQEWIAIVT